MKASHITIEEIEGILSQDDLFEKIQIVAGDQPKNRWPDISFEKTIAGRRCQFLIDFGDQFPSAVPKFILKNVAEFPVMPHINSNGVMCLFEKDTILVDPFDAVGVVRGAAQRAMRIMEDGLSSTNHIEVFKELEAYLDDLPFCQNSCSLLSERASPGIVSMVEWEGKNWFGDSKSKILSFFEKASKGYFDEKLKFQKALYVPLLDSEIYNLPLFAWKKWWQLPVLRAIFWRAVKKHDVCWESLLATRENAHLPIVFRLEFPAGDSIHFGAFFRSDSSGIHPILRRRQDESSFPIKFSRMDKDFLLPRGGARASFLDKKIMLVGCGSVGSYVAMGLAKSGVGNLTVIDPDFLKPENVHRHLLGMREIIEGGRNPFKATLLKRHIEAALPNCEIQAKPCSLETVWDEIDFASFDLAILATGNDNLNFLASEFWKENFPAKPLLFVWLDPLGIGGHALLTNIEPRGCYKCLFEGDTRNEETSPLYNKASFAAEGQSFSKTMSGCSGRFTDFGIMDVQDTASLAVRLSLDVLRGKTISNQLNSWVGDAENFLSKGFNLSRRYQKSAGQGTISQLDFADDCCPICGNGKYRKQIPTLTSGQVDHLSPSNGSNENLRTKPSNKKRSWRRVARFGLPQVRQLID